LPVALADDKIQVVRRNPAMIEKQGRIQRTRKILIIIIVCTLPCYCLGIVSLRVLSTQRNQRTTTPTITLTGTTTLTLTPTNTASLLPSATASLTNTPTYTATVTATLLPTDTPIPTLTYTMAPTVTPVLTDTPTLVATLEPEEPIATP